MLSKQERLKYPNYLLSNYQLEIYRQLASYMEANKLKKKDMAKKLKVSSPYISQVLSGNFNFTLKKLIELGLSIDKVPFLEFVNVDEYWRREKEGTIQYVVQKNTYHVELHSATKEDDPFQRLLDAGYVDYKGGILPNRVTKTEEIIK